MSQCRKIRSRAPLRLGFAGGGTDVDYYSEKFGGYVLNSTISLYAHCTVEEVPPSEVYLHAKDLREFWSGHAMTHVIEGADRLSLLKATSNRLAIKFNNGEPFNLGVTTYADAPVGSGLGTSSAIVVAMIAAHLRYLEITISAHELAELAYEIERKDCGLAGGRQDQYAATFGGFNFLEFGPDGTTVTPLEVNERTKLELETCMLTYFTGSSRDSGVVIEDQQKGAMNPDRLGALHRLRADAQAMHAALLDSDIYNMASILERSWAAKKKSSPLVSSSEVDRAMDVALKNGAISGKVSGAGGGGFLLLFVKPTMIVDITRVLSVLPGYVQTVKFEEKGVISWDAI